jgi:hypothetical protein
LVQILMPLHFGDTTSNLNARLTYMFSMVSFAIIVSR